MNEQCGAMHAGTSRSSFFVKCLHEKARAVTLLHRNDNGAFTERKVQVSAALAIPSLASLVFNISYEY